MMYGDAKLILDNATRIAQIGTERTYATETAIDLIEHNLDYRIGTDNWSETCIRDIRNLVGLYRRVSDKLPG